MKTQNKNIFLLISLLLLSSMAFSQEYELIYTYDEAGNRIKRETVELKSQTANQVLDSVMVQETLKDYKITIAPNPTIGNLNITINGQTAFEQSQLSIYAMDGTLVKRIEPVKQTNYINLRNQPPGMYILRVLINGNLQTWKIIKQ